VNKARRNIQSWYKAHGRHDLPWRTTGDPYHIWLSEVMLQQTQVATVLERYYFPFLKQFPTLEALAAAPLDAILKQWEGLGYYNRAKNLHRAAQIVVEMHKKEQQSGQTHRSAPALPSDIDALTKLPGIGKNTAHAVAAFAFGKPVPVMEANVRRILCRLHRIETPNDKVLWEIAYAMVDKAHPFAYNQAMMDIGATLCTPKAPACRRCPLYDVCEGKEEPERYPLKKRKTVPTREQHIMLYRYNGKLAMKQRTGKFLHGLWGFEEIDVPLCAAEALGEVRHAYTHFKLRCNVFLYDETEPAHDDYFTPAQICQLAISKVDEKILKLYQDTNLVNN
jgi:A/G-specific adenine glycosylase